jgi:hypothetical protein
VALVLAVDVAISGCLPAVDGGCDEQIISCRVLVGDERSRWR